MGRICVQNLQDHSLNSALRIWNQRRQNWPAESRMQADSVFNPHRNSIVWPQPYPRAGGPGYWLVHTFECNHSFKWMTCNTTFPNRTYRLEKIRRRFARESTAEVEGRYWNTCHGFAVSYASLSHFFPMLWILKPFKQYCRFPHLNQWEVVEIPPSVTWHLSWWILPHAV